MNLAIGSLLLRSLSICKTYIYIISLGLNKGTSLGWGLLFIQNVVVVKAVNLVSVKYIGQLRLSAAKVAYN
jgi:hypothetical protein